jgi:hypothetical protein
MSRIRQHLRSNIVGYIALFFALSTGSAVALNGSNTVQSDDLGPGAQVKAPDVAANAVNGSDVVDNSISGIDVNEPSLNLAAPPWRQVGSAGQPAFHETNNCEWRNYDQVHSTAAFVRDATGFVHLKGTVKPLDASSSGSCKTGIEATNQLIFVLPPGYRPSRRESMAVLTGAISGPNPAEAGTVSIDGPAISPLPVGAVAADREQIGGDVYLTLDGISFRCAPSGANGCP